MNKKFFCCGAVVCVLCILSGCGATRENREAIASAMNSFDALMQNYDAKMANAEYDLDKQISLCKKYIAELKEIERNINLSSSHNFRVAFRDYIQYLSDTYEQQMEFYCEYKPKPNQAIRTLMYDDQYDEFLKQKEEFVQTALKSRKKIVRILEVADKNGVQANAQGMFYVE